MFYYYTTKRDHEGQNKNSSYFHPNPPKSTKPKGFSENRDQFRARIKTWTQEDWQSSLTGDVETSEIFLDSVGVVFSGEEAAEIAPKPQFPDWVNVDWERDRNRTGSGWRKLRKIYKDSYNLDHGGWYLRGLDPWQDFKAPASFLQFKPYFPPKDNEGKRPKYKTPFGVPTEPIFLPVPQWAWQKVADRYEVDPQFESYSNFWLWVMGNPAIPLTVTEGGKKAGALLEQGYTAIALTGVANWSLPRTDEQKKKRHPRQLQPALLPFFYDDREINILFDFDRKPSSLENVGREVRNFSWALNQYDVTPIAVELNPRYGYRPDLTDKPEISSADKLGVDDYLKLGGDLDACYRIAGTIFREGSRKLTGKADFEYGDGYLPRDIDFKPGLNILKAPTGSGKSEAIAKWIEKERRRGWGVLNFGNRRSTAHEQSKQFGLPYADKGLTEDGVSACIESCKQGGKLDIKTSADGSFESAGHNKHIVLDECNQTFWQMIRGNTCKRDRANIQQTFKNLLNDCIASGGSIIAASADIDDNDVEYLRELVGDKVQVTIHRKEPEHPDKPLQYIGVSDREETINVALQYLEGEQRVFLYDESTNVNSKNSTKTCEQFFREKGYKVLRIDQDSTGKEESEANKVLSSSAIQLELQKYDIVITSPTISSAVSFDLPGLFGAVVGISAGIDSPEFFRQALHRVRDRNCPRYFFAPKCGIEKQGNGSASPYALHKGKMNELQEARIISGVREECLEFPSWWGIAPEYKYFAEEAALRNRVSWNFRDYFVDLLHNEKCQVETLNPQLSDIEADAIKNETKEARDYNKKETYNAIANAQDLTEEKYEELKDRDRLPEKQRLAVSKYEINNRWGDAKKDTIELDFDGKYGAIYRDFLLNYPEIAEHHDSDILTKTRWREKHKRHWQDIKVYAPTVRLLKELGIQKIIESDRTFTAEDPTVVAIANKACKNARRLKDLMGMKVSERLSNINIVKKLLKHIAHRMESKRSRNEDGKPIREYWWVAPKDRRHQYFQYWKKRHHDDHQKSWEDKTEKLKEEIGWLANDVSESIGLDHKEIETARDNVEGLIETYKMGNPANLYTMFQALCSDYGWDNVTQTFERYAPAELLRAIDNGMPSDRTSPDPQPASFRRGDLVWIHHRTTGRKKGMVKEPKGGGTYLVWELNKTFTKPPAAIPADKLSPRGDKQRVRKAG